MRKALVFLLLLIFSLSACGKPINEKIYDSVSQTHTRPLIDYALARKYLFGELHYNNGVVTDVYCENKYTAIHGVGYGRIPDPQFLNCEHTWPQSKFVGSETLLMKSDLHHLFPTESRSNSVRGNHPFGQVHNAYIVCGTSYKGTIVNTNIGGFEPPDNHKGNVARALFYFSIRYRLPLDPVQEAYLRQWHISDPVDRFEQTRNQRIKAIQGNSNAFIDDPSLVNSVQDF